MTYLFSRLCHNNKASRETETKNGPVVVKQQATPGKQRLFTRKLRPRLYHFLPNLALAGLRVQTGNYLELLIVFIVLSESL